MVPARPYSGGAMAQATRILPFNEEAIAEAARLILQGQPVAVGKDAGFIPVRP